MTNANVLQLGILVLALAAIGYGAFVYIGLDNFKAGIASEALLVLLLLGWVFSYFFRVVTGKMTFVEQRKRYRQKYEQITDKELQEKFDLLPIDQKIRLMNDIDANNNKD